MRFIAAIVVFAVSALLLVVGVAFKILAGPQTAEATVDLGSVESSYLVIDSAVLRANPGVQSIILTGSDAAFVSYGRTSDVLGWLGDSTYSTLTYDAELNELSLGPTIEAPTDLENTEAETPPAVPNAVTNPAGSDLWLDERVGRTTTSIAMNVTPEMSALVASDGVKPVPPSVTISWPLPRATFLWLNDDNLIFLGGGLAIIGLFLYLWAMSHWRNQQGPRRRGRMPKPPRPRRYKPQDTPSITAAPRGRRGAPTRRGRTAYSVVGVSVALAVGLSACSSPYETGVVVETPTAPASLAPEEQLPPVVSESQLKTILNEIVATVTKADETTDRELLKTRMSGGALATRLANYTMHANDSAIPALPPIGSLPLTFVMPQAADTWPRSVLVVSQDEEDPDSPTTGIVLVQKSPRENYKIDYMVTLEPDAYVPETAPAELGSSVVAPDSKLLMIAPQDLALAYGDVLINGDASLYYEFFDVASDTLLPQVGRDYKVNKANSIAERASLAFSEQKGSGSDVALATLDSGAIVAVTLDEVEQVTPLANGAAVIPEGQQKALLGTNATSGIRSVYTLQLLFYVPPIGAEGKIKLLGFTQGLTSATVN